MTSRVVYRRALDKAYCAIVICCNFFIVKYIFTSYLYILGKIHQLSIIFTIPIYTEWHFYFLETVYELPDHPSYQRKTKSMFHKICAFEGSIKITKQNEESSRQ